MNLALACDDDALVRATLQQLAMDELAVLDLRGPDVPSDAAEIVGKDDLRPRIPGVGLPQAEASQTQTECLGPEGRVLPTIAASLRCLPVWA